MRVDNDTYVWGVKKIILERKPGADNRRVAIRFVDADGEDANANVTVWGDVTGPRAHAMPEIWLHEEGAEPVCVSELGREPKPLDALTGPNLTENDQ